MPDTSLIQNAKAWWRWLRLSHFRDVIRRIDHLAIVQLVRDDGHLSGRYTFMNLMACGIATLGLLLSSPAVIIGAMLISPLMGPIILMGFSLCILDLRALRNSILTIAVGVALAVGASATIVLVSPLTLTTPEILARTQPNLFDLLVAVFSGLAGGYAVINQKGGTVVGVAIATALMPPLCVAGYGLATGSGAIAFGAAFLFMTNLLAIALTVTCVAKFYGFGATHSPTHSLWQMALIVAVFVALSIPLGLALRSIASEATVSTLARLTVQDYVQARQARLSDFSISFKQAGDLRVDTVVLTRTYDPATEADLGTLLETRLARPVAVTVDQVLIDQDKSLDQAEILRLAETSLAAPLQAQLSRYQRRETLVSQLEGAASFKIDAIDLDQSAGQVRLFAAPSRYVPLSAYREMEASLDERFAQFQVKIVPPPQPLPSIFFSIGSADMDERAEDALATVVWSLSRWGVSSITAVGYASSLGEGQRFDNVALAARRSQAVLDYLKAKGFAGEAVYEYGARDQADTEREFGVRSFHKVDVRLGEPEVKTATP